MLSSLILIYGFIVALVPIKTFLPTLQLPKIIPSGDKIRLSEILQSWQIVAFKLITEKLPTETEKSIKLPSNTTQPSFMDEYFSIVADGDIILGVFIPIFSIFFN